MIRAFIALALSESQIRDLSDLADKLKQDAGFMNLKWSKPHNYHLTMRFLGDIRESSVDELEQQLERHLAHKTSIRLDFTKLELFPSPSRPSVLAITAEVNPEITSCLKSVDRALHGTNLHIKRVTFRPHITIARIPKAQSFTAHPEIVCIDRSLEFNLLELIQSRLTPDGPVYRSLCEFNLPGMY